MKTLSKKYERKLFIKKDKIKTNKLFTEYFELRNNKRNMVEIVPYKRGYDRALALTQETINRDDSNRIQEALNYCNNKDWSRNKEFTYKDYKTKKTVKKELYPKPIDKEVFELKVPSYLHKFFELQFHYNNINFFKYKNNISTGKWVYVWKYNNMLKYVIKSHWVTHAYIMDPDIASRLGELKSIIETNNLWQKYYKYKSIAGRYDDWDSRYKFIKNDKFIKKQQLNEINN